MSDKPLSGANCFACGPDNPIGLRIRFEMQGDICVGQYTPLAEHVGFDGVVHGGLLFTSMDDVMANWLYLQDMQGHTGKANIRYRRPAAVGKTLRLEGRALEQRRRVVKLSGRAIEVESGELVCEAEASFMLAK